MNSHRALAALTAGILVLAACGGGSSADSATESTAPVSSDAAVAPAGSDPATESAPADPATESAPADPATESAPADEAEPDSTVPAALQFSAPLVGGGELDASALAGKPTVFWFWAPT